MRLAFRLALTLAIITLPLHESRAGDEEKAATPEASSLDEYSRLASEGRSLLKRGDNAAAAKKFEAVLAIPTHYGPNYDYFPDLALAYFRSGQPEKAKQALERAQVAMSLIAGVCGCVEDEVKVVGGEICEKVDPRANEDVAKRMCDAIYTPYGTHPTIDDFLTDANWVRHVLDVQKEIASGKPGSKPPPVRPR